MGKPTGFIEFNRQTAAEQPVKNRLEHFQEYSGRIKRREFSAQAARCMDCGIPFCHSNFGCPVYNLIPEWNDLIYRDMWKEAYERLELTNNFPEITGRICPAPCESACTLSINDSPVTIKQIELAIIERAYDEGWVVPKPPSSSTGKSAAVIGSGPAGLAAAQQLRRAGHSVTVFEKDARIGGLLRYGIPDFKLEKKILDSRINQMQAEGVKFESNVEIGEDLSARYLQKTFDAVLIAIGARQPRPLNVPGSDLQGIHYAMDYLTRVNKFTAGDLRESEIISAKDKNVLVLGGGDTGSDCVGTANRQGAKNVYQFEILPKPAEWKKAWNPEWPNWPQILRTSSSQAEGCEREWSILTKSFNGKNKKLISGSFNRLEWMEDPENGKLKMHEIPESDFSLDLDLVFLSLGFIHVQHNRLLEQIGIKFHDNGNILTDENYKTSAAGYFAAGDAHTGANLVVRAVYHGRQAAESINKYLSEL